MRLSTINVFFSVVLAVKIFENPRLFEKIESEKLFVKEIMMKNVMAEVRFQLIDTYLALYS